MSISVKLWLLFYNIHKLCTESVVRAVANIASRSGVILAKDRLIEVTI